MKVAIDIGPLSSGDKIRGVGFYTKELVGAMEQESRKVKDFELVQLDSDAIVSKASEFSLVHVPYFNPFFETVPTNINTPLVVSIHDVIPLLYPDKYPSGIKGRLKLQKQKNALKHVSAIITDTEASKKDIVRFLDVDKEKIYVTHLASAKHFKKVTGQKLQDTKRKYNLPDKFVLYVGDVNYNKNVPTMVKAAQMAKIPLVVVGKHAQEIEGATSDLSHLHGPRDWVRFLFGKPHPEVAHYTSLSKLFIKTNTKRIGFVSDSDLVCIYNLATLYCQPSFAEGFGLPVLEAMACGVPVVASKTQAIVEVADKAALYASPEDANTFSKHFKDLSRDKNLRNKMVKLGNVRQKKFSWQETAKETIAVYKLISR